MHAAEESADDNHVISPSPSSSSSKTPDFLKVLTTPFTELIIQLDKQVLKGWATNEEKYVNATTILRLGCHNSNSSSEGAGGCDYLFAYLGVEGAGLGEAVMGVILLLLSLVMLCTCLIGNIILTTIQRDFTKILTI
jgi:sodium-dependent phosphate cotransporter